MIEMPQTCCHSQSAGRAQGCVTLTQNISMGSLGAQLGGRRLPEQRVLCFLPCNGTGQCGRVVLFVIVSPKI